MQLQGAQCSCPWFAPGGDQSILSRIQGLGGLDPVNQMPREPNQQPVPGQRKPLPRDRVPSSIPKGGTDTAWVYPSPQMFYNGAQFAPQMLSRQLTAAPVYVDSSVYGSLSKGIACEGQLRCSGGSLEASLEVGLTASCSTCLAE